MTPCQKTVLRLSKPVKIVHSRRYARIIPGVYWICWSAQSTALTEAFFKGNFEDKSMCTGATPVILAGLSSFRLLLLGLACLRAASRPISMSAKGYNRMSMVYAILKPHKNKTDTLCLFPLYIWLQRLMDKSFPFRRMYSGVCSRTPKLPQAVFLLRRKWVKLFILPSLGRSEMLRLILKNSL